ncbi:MAG: hypothetical protein ACI9SP_004032 [Arenicella sp.]|jgi:hypothetical protein
MELSIDTVESKFGSYLDKFGNSVDIIQFRKAYLRLVLMFKEELETTKLEGALELLKCFSNEQYDKPVLDDLEKSCRESLNQNLKSNASMSREALLNQLLFGALLEAEEIDFFYVTEPLFLFAKEMGVAAAELDEILMSEFIELYRI